MRLSWKGQSELEPQGDPVDLGEASVSVSEQWAAPSLCL